MTEDSRKKSGNSRHWAGALGLAAAATGMVAILGLALGYPDLASLGPGNIPMAPSTALMFMVQGILVAAATWVTLEGSGQRSALAVSLCGALAALVLLILSYRGIHLDMEKLGIPITGTLDKAPLGHMSPLTAVCFVLSSLSLATWFSRFRDPETSGTLVFWSAGLLVLISISLVLAYLYGTPFLYGTAFIPPAATTSLAFLCLGAGLVVLSMTRARSGQESYPMEGYLSHVLILLFIALTAGIVLAGYVYFSHHARLHRASVEGQLSAIADLKVNELARWRQERFEDALVFHQNGAFGDTVSRFLDPGQDTAPPSPLGIWLSRIRTAHGYDRVYVMDPRGTIRMSDPDTADPASPETARNAARAMAGDTLVFGDLHRDSPETPVYLELFVPIPGVPDTRGCLGVLVLRIDPGIHLYPLIRFLPVKSPSAEIYLVRRDDDQGVVLTDLRFLENTALNLTFSMDQTRDRLSPLAVQGRTGIVETTDYRGVPVVACLKAVPGSPWFLIARRDAAEILKPLNERLAVTILLVASLLLGTGAGIILVWRHRQSRFLQERLQAGETIRANEARFHHALDSMLEGCQILGRNWQYLYVNPEAVRQSGRSRAELLGNRMTDLFPDMAESDLFHVLKHAMDEQSACCMENQFHYPDGSSAWFYLSIQPVPEGLFIVSMDITQKKLAEKREKHLHAIIRAIRKVNQLITKERNRERLIAGACANLVETRGFNSAWILLLDPLGKPRHLAESGLGDRFSALKRHIDQGNLPACVTHALARDGVVVMEDTSADCPQCPVAPFCQGRASMEPAASFRVRLEHGTTLYGTLTASVPLSFAQDPEEQGLFQEVGSDIAFGLHTIDEEEKRARTVVALGQSEARYRALFEGSGQGILIAEIQTRRFRYANPAICAMLGYTEQEMQHLGLEDLHPEKDLDLVVSTFNALAETGFGEVRAVPCLKKDGTLLYTDISSTRTRIDGVACNVGFFTDITRQRNLEQQLHQSQKLESIGRFSGGIAHDFNNILTTVIANAGLILDDLPQDDPLREELEDIRTAGERGASLTRQLLAFSRKQVLQPTLVNLNEVALGMEKMLRRMIGEDIALKTVLAPDLGLVRADVGQIEQVLMNLAVNARDAMPRGGTLTLETANLLVDEAYAAAHLDLVPGPHVLLAVSDTGCGMTSQVREQIFEPFFTTKEKGKGTGLGLSTVYGIIRQSNGTIGVYSEPGLGTRFRIHLPRAGETPQPLESDDRKTTLPLGTGTVLVVEDHEMTRNLAVRVLTRYGYTVLPACDGDQALRISEEHDGPVHLLLTDVIMPGMDVQDMKARLTAARPDMKVLFMSGYTDATIVEHGVLDTGVSFIGKPFTAEALGNTVRNLLSPA
ncbi:MAG: PAS domain S-box protein [Pseudomonadota bacterium]